MKMVYLPLLRKISGNPSRNLPFRLIWELGEDGEKVFLALMKKLLQDAKKSAGVPLPQQLRRNSFGKA